MHQFYSLRRL